MEKIWNYTFNDLQVDPTETPVLLTEPTFNPNPHRLKTTEIMFESFQLPLLYLANTAVLELFSSGRTTGVVLECGAGVTNVVPIYEGHALPHCTTSLDVAGTDLTELMLKLLCNQRGRHYLTLDTTYSDITREDARLAKEKLCFVASDFDRETDANVQTNELEIQFELLDKSADITTVPISKILEQKKQKY
jgi:actin-related protein